MKTIFLLLMFLSINSFCANVVTNPATNATNTITPTASSVSGLTVNSSAGSQGSIVANNTNDWDAVDATSTNGVGLFGHSDNFYGVMGESVSSYSGYFSSSAGTNSAPTVVIQQIGTSTADLLQVQDGSGNIKLRIDHNGVIHGSIVP